MLNAALGYAELKSWPVFPVSAKEKNPLIQRGFKAASRDPRMIREWWRRHPTAGIGLAIPEGVLVVDVDPRNSGVAPAGLPDTRTAKTRSDGTHLYFVVPAGLSFVGQAAPGVDLKAAGKGYVLLPPTPGYTWVKQGAMASLPQVYLDQWTRDSIFQSVDSGGSPRYMSWEKGTRYGLVALANQALAVASSKNGDRNNALYKASVGLYSLVAGGELAEDLVSETMLMAASTKGLEHEEAVRTLMSARLRGYESPRRAQ